MLMAMGSTPALADEAALQRQIYQLQQDIATLRGEMEQLRYLVSRQNGSTSASTSAPSSSASNGGAVIADKPAQSVGAATADGEVSLKGVDAKAQKAYNDAYAMVQKNDLKGAQSAFKSYVETYEDNALTPNAWYWLGQVQFSQAVYDQARLSFLNVARYNDSQKRPDALYKLGMISKFLGDNDKALRYFQLVIQTYPSNAAASLAQREVARLQGK